MNEWFPITLLNEVNWEIIGSSHATLLTEATFEINSYAKLIRDPPHWATEREVGILSDTSLEAK